MIPVRLPLAARRRYVALLGGFAALLPCLQAQTAPAATPAELAKYDLNKNGVIDADEMSAFEAGRKSDTVLLTPFEVSTAKDTGYAAGSALSGGRADTPLKLTSASVSVMTKEFLDDFAITDMNQAMQYTVGMDANVGGESGPFGSNRFQPSIRGSGVGQTYPARDGALQYFIADSYNTERLEFSRGPNAALFGDSGPGGSPGSSGKQARLNDRRNQISLRGDTFGGYRATLDTNYGTDRFAVRFNALRQNAHNSIQEGIGNFQQAVTLDGTFKISESTQIRAEYSHSHEWNIQYRRTYAENASLWDRKTFNNDNSVLASTTGTGLSTYGSTTVDRLVYNFGTNSLINYRGVQYQTNGLGYAIPWHGRPDIPGFVGGIGKTFNLGPADAIASRDLNAKSFNIDHRFNPDLFLNLGAIQSDVDPAQINTNSLPNDYRIDVNRLLPDGTPNPKFGKPYAEGSDGRQYQANNVTEFRYNLSYKFEVPKIKLSQRFVFNGGWRQDLYEAWSHAWRRIDNPTTPNPTNAVNALNFRIYYDQPRPNVHPIFQPNIGGMKWGEIASGFNADNNNRLIYNQVISQSSFFDDRVGLTLSVRRDKNELDTQSGIGQDPTGFNVIMGAPDPKTLLNVAGLRSTGNLWQTSKNGGTVVYPFPDRWVWARPLGFVANYSQNFSVPNTGAPLITGKVPVAPVATTEDYGLRYAYKENVAYITVSHYHTKQIGNLQNFGNLTDFRNIYLNLGYTDSAHTGTDFNYRDTNDRILEGFEVEAQLNPNRNISLTVNYSHPIVTTILDSPDRRAYYAANLAEFTAGSKAQPGQVINGRTILDPVAIASAMQNIENSFNGFTPGTLANGLERHRINVVGRYELFQGPLKGFTFNASFTYRAHRKAGSVDPIIKYQLQRAATVLEANQAGYDYLWVRSTYATTLGVNYKRQFGKYRARFQLNVENVLNDDKPQWGLNNGNNGNAFSVINAGQLQNNSTGNVYTVPGGNNRVQVLSQFSQLDPRKFIFSTTLDF